MSKKRNGEIDIIRFVLSIMILIYHFAMEYSRVIFDGIYIAPEFFFLVTGYFMAAHVRRLPQRDLSNSEIANETWRFMMGKISKIYPHFVVTLLLQLVLVHLIVNYKGIMDAASIFLHSMPAFTMTHLGLNFGSRMLFEGNSWYLSAMVISLFVLYPVLLKYRDLATKVIFPAAGLFILGYMNQTLGFISSFSNWTGFCLSGILRGISVIALGAALYALIQWIKEQFVERNMELRLIPKLIITAAKIACFGLVVVYIVAYPFDNINAFFYMMIGLALSFSGLGYSIPASKFTELLGKLSLPIYIYHGVHRNMAVCMFTDAEISDGLFWGMCAVSIAASICLMYLTEYLMKWVRKAFAASVRVYSK